MTLIDLTPRLRLAADYVSVHGWTQGEEVNSAGQVCLTGAIRLCAPQNGDEYLIREVLWKRGRAENWNDRRGMSEGEVVDYLATAEISDADLADTFGPQWEQVVGFVRTSVKLNADQLEELAGAVDFVGHAFGDARAAAWTAALHDSRSSDGAATGAAAPDTFPEPARNVVEAAVSALVIRDLIGTHCFTQQHYDTLTGPWRTLIGQVHPDDSDTLTLPWRTVVLKARPDDSDAEAAN